MKLRYREGDVLFREGDPGDFVARILEGRVAVEKDHEGEAIGLGELGPGDFVGEMGVIERKPRSATVRALAEVAVELIPADAFLERIATEPAMARALLFRLSEKVRTLSEEVVRLHHPHETESPTPSPSAKSQPVSAQGNALVQMPPSNAPVVDAERHVQFYQRSATASTRISLRCECLPGTQAVWVEHLPFRVARTLRWNDPPSLGRSIMRVPDAEPHRLSNPHFAIDRDDRLGLVVRDLGSELGTTVNGQYLGGIFAKDTQVLHLGQNTVVAGGVKSPFVFRIDVTG
jgi:cAMP-binding proteins - catabolite gene activator and regulatory subunit of cAMP-dependent protein kinases